MALPTENALAFYRLEKAVRKKHKPLRVYFQDEARFSRMDNPTHCWAPRPSCLRSAPIFWVLFARATEIRFP
ncbi:TPA: hypothetical protein DDW35_01190 [Candidatus Sumerlaeota bacterium]|nr:hypothetical protein [Candidatus Sumerlaeota bacterium]